MGRVDRRLLRVMRELIAQGATVHLICQPGSPMTEPALAMGATVAPYRLDRWNYVRTRSRVKKYLRRFQPAVVHCTGLEAELIVRTAARSLHTKVVDSLHCARADLRSESPVARAIARRLDRGTRPAVDLFVVDCASLADRLVAEGVDRSKILIDLPSVDIAEVRAAAERPAAVPRAHGRPVVGYVGRLEPSRGLDVLAAAAPVLQLGGHPATVVIAGEGPAAGALRRGQFAQYVELLGPVENAPATLTALDVCCFPSTCPGVPTTLLEAAVLGKPIVASAVEGVEELFENGREIVLVPPGDPSALAAAIGRLLADGDEAADMGERARLRAVDEYSAAVSVTRHLNLYRSLTSA